MQDGIREAAIKHPQIKFIHISGDDVLTRKSPQNLSNLMGRMEYEQMMAGFAAALTTKTGNIGYDVVISGTAPTEIPLKALYIIRTASRLLKPVKPPATNRSGIWNSCCRA